MQGGPAHLTMKVWHFQQRREISSFSEALWIDSGWLQGMTESKYKLFEYNQCEYSHLMYQLILLL